MKRPPLLARLRTALKRSPLPPDEARRFVDAAYRAVFRRPPDPKGSAAYLAFLEKTGSPAALLQSFLSSKEFKGKQLVEHATLELLDKSAGNSGRDGQFHAPVELRRTRTPLRRALLIGACFIESWQEVIGTARDACPCDHVLVNHYARLPETPPHPFAEYDFQIVQVPLRTVLPEPNYLYLRYADRAGWQRAFDQACDLLHRCIEELMRWNIEHGLLTFFCNFLVPQQNPMGRLLPRYELSNLSHFVEQLNVTIAQELRKYRNAFLLDADRIAAIYGKRYSQDDSIWLSAHGALISNHLAVHDDSRIEVPPRPSQLQPFRTDEFIRAVWSEAVAMFRTVRQVDAVKLVIVDLDDTLWRGVAGEEEPESERTSIEGWPVALAETLQFLKKRGVLLAIASKNEESRVRSFWRARTLDRIRLEDFAVCRINWRPKVENIAEILETVNVLPRNVVFVDDNPVERAAVKAAYPAMRVLGQNPHVLRRILLWSAETQVVQVTAESGRKTEMVQAQARRETSRKEMSREAFLASLQLRLVLDTIRDPGSPRFARALELVNKTNQFNTTGQRWTHESCQAHFAAGGVWHVFDVADTYSEYGLVGVVIVRGAEIQQWAMSCRVLGMDVELAALSEIGRRLAQSTGQAVTASLVETDANFPCRDFFQRGGFVHDSGIWTKAASGPWPIPSHVSVSWRAEPASLPKAAAA